MDRLIRRKLTMARRALEFARAYPSTDASWSGVVSRLEELLSRADTLALTERQGRADRATASRARRELRARIHADHLRHLGATAEVAFKEELAVPGGFRVPRGNAPYLAFIAAARAMHAAGEGARERLIAVGLGETLLDDLRVALGELEQVGEVATTSRRSHMVARGELRELGDALTEQVRLLDGLLRPRLRQEPGLRDTWERIRTLEGPTRASRSRSAVPDPEGSVTTDRLLPPTPAVDAEERRAS